MVGDTLTLMEEPPGEGAPPAGEGEGAPSVAPSVAPSMASLSTSTNRSNWPCLMSSWASSVLRAPSRAVWSAAGVAAAARTAPSSCFSATRS